MFRSCVRPLKTLHAAFKSCDSNDLHALDANTWHAAQAQSRDHQCKFGHRCVLMTGEYRKTYSAFIASYAASGVAFQYRHNLTGVQYVC